MTLPIFQTEVRELSLLQTSWASSINPVLSNQLLAGNLLTNVSLANGVTTINHLLGRKMVGWIVTDLDGAAQIFRSEPLNAKTLTLTSDAAIVASIYVF